MHSVTDRQTDRQTDNRPLPIADHTVQQYDRLKTVPLSTACYLSMTTMTTIMILHEVNQKLHQSKIQQWKLITFLGVPYGYNNATGLLTTPPQSGSILMPQIGLRLVPVISANRYQCTVKQHTTNMCRVMFRKVNLWELSKQDFLQVGCSSCLLTNTQGWSTDLEWMAIISNWGTHLAH